MRTFVLCDQCQKEGKKSRVTCNPPVVDRGKVEEYWDEDGELHQHDGNRYGYHYNCSQGHNWDDYKTAKCWCQIIGVKNA